MASVFPFLGDFINNYYFPVFVPIGIVGNVLSFVVSTINRTYQEESLRNKIPHQFQNFVKSLFTHVFTSNKKQMFG